MAVAVAVAIAAPRGNSKQAKRSNAKQKKGVFERGNEGRCMCCLLGPGSIDSILLSLLFKPFFTPHHRCSLRVRIF